MQISKINAFNNNIYAQRKINKTNNQTRTLNTDKTLSPVSFSGSIYYFNNSSDQETFLKQNGRLKFDKAYKNSLFYNGSIVSGTNSSKTESVYKNGEKTAVKTTWQEGPQSSASSILFTEKRTMEHDNGSKTIEWYDENSNALYVEDYNCDGDLSETYLYVYKKNNKKPKQSFGMHEIKPYNIDTTAKPLIYIERHLDKRNGNALRETTELDGEKQRECGYKTRMIDFALSGDKETETYLDFVDKQHKMTSDSKTVTYRNNKPVKSVQENCRYYTDDGFEIPYAECKERIAVNKKESGTVVTEKRYFITDYTQGLNPIRKFAFTQKPNTIRQTKYFPSEDKAGIIYFDGDTKKPYACEIYDSLDDELPTDILNFDDGFHIEIQNNIRNLVSLRYFKGENDEKMIAMGGFRVHEGKYTPWQFETYDTVDSIEQTDKPRKTSIIRFGKNDTKIITYINPDNSISRSEKYFGDELYASAIYENGKMTKQEITPYFDPKRVIEYKDDNEAVEYTYYGKSDSIASKTFYKDKLAQKRIYYDESGKQTETELFKDGILISSQEEPFKEEVRLNEADFSTNSLL